MLTRRSRPGSRPGTVCALVGPSGAGKTTFANLVPRFFDAGGGPRERSTASTSGACAWRTCAATSPLVSQDPVLFNDTVYNNLLLGRLDATPDEVVERRPRAPTPTSSSAPSPRATTPWSASGARRLSGGQKQRLALARAFLRNAPILILDEATSALDSAERADDPGRASASSSSARRCSSSRTASARSATPRSSSSSTGALSSPAATMRSSTRPTGSTSRSTTASGPRPPDGSRPTIASMPQSPRILVIRRRYLGDVVLLGSLFRNLRIHWPAARIAALVEPAYARDPRPQSRRGRGARAARGRVRVAGLRSAPAGGRLHACPRHRQHREDRAHLEALRGPCGWRSTTGRTRVRLRALYTHVAL